MATEVQICNLALSHIGTYSIQSLTENTTLAAACNLHYEIVRDAVLGDHAWGFAKKRETLALLSETYSGWDYAYAYPTDCIMALEIYDLDGSVSGTIYDPETGSYFSAGKVEFEISVNDVLNQKLILTNKEDAELVYTARVTTPNLFGTLFVDALSYALAVSLTQPLKADKELKVLLQREYVLRLTRAEARSANESFKKPDNSNNTFVNAR